MPLNIFLHNQGVRDYQSIQNYKKLKKYSSLVPDEKRETIFQKNQRYPLNSPLLSLDLNFNVNILLKELKRSSSHKSRPSPGLGVNLLRKKSISFKIIHYQPRISPSSQQTIAGLIPQHSDNLSEFVPVTRKLSGNFGTEIEFESALLNQPLKNPDSLKDETQYSIFSPPE